MSVSLLACQLRRTEACRILLASGTLLGTNKKWVRIILVIMDLGSKEGIGWRKNKGHAVKYARVKCMESVCKQFTFTCRRQESTRGAIKLLKRKRLSRCYKVSLPPQFWSRNLRNISLPSSSVRVLRNVQECLILRELKMYILSTLPRVSLYSLNRITGDLCELILEIYLPGATEQSDSFYSFSVILKLCIILRF